MLHAAVVFATVVAGGEALSPRNEIAPATVGAAWPLASPSTVTTPVLQAKAFNLTGAPSLIWNRPVSPPSPELFVCHRADVRLIADDDNHFQQAQELNTDFLKYLEADRLLYTFRTIAKLPQVPGAEPYGGWLSPTGHVELVNGHFTGHFLSALAFTAASTDDPAIIAKSKYLVGELAKCQEAICTNNATHCGYLSAFYFSQVEAMENHEGGTWATLYTLHKIMAGLLDTFENTANDQALEIAVKMANWLKKRVGAVIHNKGWAWWEQCLEVEFGGMNEVGYNLFAITQSEEHKILGDYFYKARFMDPLAHHVEYALTGQHANTHLPEIIGIARGWEITGNSTLSDITQFFYKILTDHYTYSATGGSNVGEHWLYPDQQGTAIATVPGHDSSGYHTEESCTQCESHKFSTLLALPAARAVPSPLPLPPLLPPLPAPAPCWPMPMPGRASCHLHPPPPALLCCPPAAPLRCPALPCCLLQIVFDATDVCGPQITSSRSCATSSSGTRPLHSVTTTSTRLTTV